MIKYTTVNTKHNCSDNLILTKLLLSIYILYINLFSNSKQRNNLITIIIYIIIMFLSPKISLKFNKNWFNNYICYFVISPIFIKCFQYKRFFLFTLKETIGKIKVGIKIPIIYQISKVGTN